MEIFAYIMIAVVGLPSLIHLFRRFAARHEPRPPQGEVYDVFEAAFLTAGPGRVADTVLAVLAAERKIEIRDPGIVALREFTPRHPVEAGVIEAFRTLPTSSLHWLRIAVMRGAAVQAVGDGLAARGLARRPEDPKPLSRRGLPLSVTGLALCVWALITPVAAVALALYGLVALPLALSTARRITSEGRIALVRYGREHASSPDLAVQVALHGRARIPDRDLYLQLTNASGPGARYQQSSSSVDPGVLFATTVSWCGGGSDHSSCGGSSCGSSGDSGWSSGGGGGGGCSSGSSCGGSSSSCGSSSGGSSCGGGGGGGSSCGSSS
ncbi:TIGR04222 domain-containing membrane protein [Streptomyces indicus]|uniref:TIGR04222 domain-containing protein n=1 Tax=Streptomyces indicus TaxID=417292 RepID=A0A1G9API7_9ACTN|nr:TIGR04222 domain-containing membrane protein [Streptomyces indicus]SDK28500.1 TIGR04222 domain-containing protein [Streptomyces indicus]